MTDLVQPAERIARPQPQAAPPNSTAEGGCATRASVTPISSSCTSEFPFSITVAEVYDGLLDLLLDLIRKQDIEIYDIPIGQITAQYLHYVSRMKQLDVEMAAEIGYIASVLIDIKSKMLLP